VLLRGLVFPLFQSCPFCPNTTHGYGWGIGIDEWTSRIGNFKWNGSSEREISEFIIAYWKNSVCHFAMTRQNSGMSGE
jgi:hypothetical protein